MDGEFKDLQKRIKAALNKSLKRVAAEITEEIQVLYNQTIDEFYAQYSPRRYQRTLSTYHGSDSYRTLHDPIREGDGYLAGISVSPDNIPGDPYRADKDWVFERTFVKGYHGYNSKEIKSWRQNNNIRELIKTGKYYFNWMPGMNVQRPSPSKSLESKVRQLSKGKSKKLLDQMFTDELTKILS